MSFSIRFPYRLFGMRQLVLRATTLISEASDPAEQQQRQEELERVVNSPDAWGLITPFLEYDSDPNVQFYGAHILGVKIARAWNTLDTSIHFPLRDSILELTGRAIALQRPKMVLRRLYIAITAIALKLTTASPPQWSDFLTSSLLALQSQGANKEALLEFMTIAVEEVHRAPKGSNNHIADAVNAAIPSFMDTFTSTVLSSTSKETENLLALKCLQSWIGWGLSGNDITTVVPTLISILSTPPLFIATSDALQDILIASAMADGAGIKTITEPLMKMAKILFGEVVTILRRKVMWPTPAQMQESGGWDAEQRENFTVYRRNVGDTLINACYVLRDQFLTSLLEEMKVQLAQASQQPDIWESIEAILFSIKAVHDALTSSNLEPLEFLFHDSAMNALPQAGPHRVRWTMLTLIAEYATYFSTAPSPSSLLRAVNYTASALSEPSLSLQASVTLKELCDANRATLAPHISSFADLHQNVELLGPEEKSKVLESIASVISALPPGSAIDPVAAIVHPLLRGLAKALDPQLDHEAAHQLCIAQLRSLTGCARGLTIVSDPLEEKFVPDHTAISQARLDPKMSKVRDDIVLAIRTVTERWWSNAEITGALSELIKAITATAAEESILSLPPQPLLGIIAEANTRQISSTWLTLATILAGQLHPPKTLDTLNPVPTVESINFIQELTPRILGPSFDVIRDAAYMEANPDIVQEFFRFSETIAHHFLVTIYRLPQNVLSSLLQRATIALGLQERYSLVGSCKFLVTLLRETFANGDLTREADALMDIHGKQMISAVIYAVASSAPRSATVNIGEVLYYLASKRAMQSRAYLTEILFSADFTTKHPLATQKSKEQFISLILAARSGNKTRAAISQFQSVARGLEGTSYGYVSI
ncbi:hypothetical protein FRC19_007021 [Serendipita sp. 401]|nr:hypothetical protein FRC19_007021 [Serendipita sp. 401]